MLDNTYISNLFEITRINQYVTLYLQTLELEVTVSGQTMWKAYQQYQSIEQVAIKSNEAANILIYKGWVIQT